ncbi:MAG: phosphohistidine phosphatase SixA [Elusimicrobia bacterium GWA2_69_24]|nr:MAG: phosphohistidine phosphatase SixA [Elusimicrobia bacterium GWA2_69_24]
MKLYVLRHGKSPSSAEARVTSDFDRPLAAEGRDAVRKAASFLAAKGARPALILASPLVRAQQTAVEAAGRLVPKPAVRTYPPLENQMSGMDLFRHLSEEELPPEVILVGHQPQLGDLASYLTGKYFSLKPGGLIAVQTDGKGKAELLWSANPSDYPA